MAKQEKNILEGVIIESLPSLSFRVKLDESDREILARLAGKMRLNRIRVLIGDRVKVEMSPYDKNRGRIVYRDKPNNYQPNPNYRRR